VIVDDHITRPAALEDGWNCVTAAAGQDFHLHDKLVCIGLANAEDFVAARLAPDSRISCLSFSCDFAERNLSISERHYRDAGSFVERLSGYILCVWSQRELLALICSCERKTVSKKNGKNWRKDAKKS
jgi:hypothetical protein